MRYLLCHVDIADASTNTCQVIESSAKERFNLGAALVMKATMKATETSQLSISEPRSRRSSPLAFAQSYRKRQHQRRSLTLHCNSRMRPTFRHSLSTLLKKFQISRVSRITWECCLRLTIPRPGEKPPPSCHTERRRCK